VLGARHSSGAIFGEIDKDASLELFTVGGADPWE